MEVNIGFQSCGGRPGNRSTKQTEVSSNSYPPTSQSVLDIGLRYDGVSFKDTASAPSADLHDDAFRNSSAPEIPCGRPAKIMKEQAGHTCRDTRLLPRPAEVAYFLPAWSSK